ncbi:MAG TPA: muramoyltetrapeptide carboxypeptidase [Burkholderiaceae bacterium]|nr:muramoyltetrapeptide carboxypeptidase [Burkholderiaceae bacterium]
MAESRFSFLENTGVAIVAPGGYAPNEAALVRGIALLEAQGCRVMNYYQPSEKYQRFGANDEARVEQLHAAACNPDVQIVLALRGGYGISRILPQIDFRQLADCGKLFVGHSDITALHLGLLAQAGAVSFAGPMVCDDFTREDPSDFTIRHFRECLCNPTYSFTAAAENNPMVNVSGTLWGGNLTMLTHLIGTPYFPQIDGGILFVEDINEHPYRVERMMLQLLHAGVLGRQNAILLGDFSSYRLTDYDNGYDFAAMLAYLRTRLETPVLTGLPFGHLRDKVTLAVGCHAQLISDNSSFQLAMNGYPHLSVNGESGNSF